MSQSSQTSYVILSFEHLQFSCLKQKKPPFWLTLAHYSGEYNGQVAISTQEGRALLYLKVIGFYLFPVCSTFFSTGLDSLKRGGDGEREG